MAFPKKVNIGDPFREFPAASFNALVESDRNLKATLRRFVAENGRGNQAYLATQLHNSTATDLVPGHILGYGDLAVEYDDDESQVFGSPILKGVTPVAADHASQFAVALDYIAGTESVAGGVVGTAAFQGLVPVKVNWTDAAHDRVKVSSDETLLQSSSSGIKPVWRQDFPLDEHEEPDLPAELWALVLLGASGGSSASTTFGYVITTAAKNYGTAGTFVPLGSTGLPLDADGNTLIVDPEDEDYDEEKVDAVKESFKSAHEFADCVAGARIQATKINGEYRALLTDAPRELKQLSGYAEDKVIFSDTTTVGMIWAGEVCEEVEE